MKKPWVPMALGILFYGLMASVVFVAVTEYVKAKSESLPELGQVEPFELVNEQGEIFGLERLVGRVWVADFIFTSCAGPCPIMSRKMSQLQGFFNESPWFSLVSFSVDPDRDTPEVLYEYARTYGAQSGRWNFLTGTPEAIAEVAKESFKMGAIDEPMFHSTYFVLIDVHGSIRGYYDSEEEEELKRLKKNVAFLLRNL